MKAIDFVFEIRIATYGIETRQADGAASAVGPVRLLPLASTTTTLLDDERTHVGKKGSLLSLSAISPLVTALYLS